MSTPISQTLFRFVSMRNPELSDENGLSKRFILRPAGSTGSFDTAVANKPSGQTNWQALKNAAATFGAWTKVSDVKALSPALYDFSVWLARNRSTCTQAELQAKIAGLTVLAASSATALWNNLIYQVVTQKDFYIKEAIMQLLLADHLVANFKSTAGLPAEAAAAAEAANQQLLHAKAVLPKELFRPSNAGNGAFATMAMAAQALALIPEALEKKQTVALSQLEIAQYQALKKELSVAEKAYRKEFRTSYDAQWQKHDDTVKSIMAEYEQQVEEAKRQWCSVRNPEIPFDAEDPCMQPPVIPRPDLPRFEFSFRPELDMEFLQSKLSADGMFALQKVLAGSTPVQAQSLTASGISLSDLDSFEELHRLIDSSAAQLHQTIRDYTDTGAATAISIGGVVIPVAGKPDSDGTQEAGYHIAARTLPVSASQWSMLLTVDADAANVVGASYQAVHSGDRVIGQGDTFQQVAPGTYKLFSNSPIPVNGSIDSFQVKGSLQLADGKQYEFQADLAPDKTYGIDTITGTFPWKGGGRIPWETGPLTPVDTVPAFPYPPLNNEPPFIPSGFGFKQLGIADYKKVEQSIHCYVEGEVAHIENVMAREYKEKATRKLRKSETTTTVTSENEREQLSDTTSADRFEMQSEVAKVLKETKDFSANASLKAKWSAGAEYEIGAGANFATHNSKEESIRQSVKQAKDITERAMERIVTKVKEERIEKIVEEFEEHNKHGFDNTQGDKHVVGVYRWVDKIYKNQIYNYGKRLMFEFMVPQPAKIHTLGMIEGIAGTRLVQPVDPRTFDLGNTTPASLNMKDFTEVDLNTAKYWAGKYNVEIDPMPVQTMKIGKSFSYTTPESQDSEWDEVAAGNAEIQIPEGYYTTYAKAAWYESAEPPGPNTKVIVGGKIMSASLEPMNGYVGTIPCSYSVIGHHSGSVNVELTLQLLPEYYAKWQQETFNAIISGYEDAMAAYNQKLAEEEAKGVKIKGENPGFYRQIENIVLRKNCISYLINPDPNAALTFGKDKYYLNDGSTIPTFGNTAVKVDASLDNYASFVKFMEQAFEWEIMSYYFYPYYWGKRADWASLYQYDNNDPLFRAFMQSGMARVIVTVRPGFEDAVRHYMATGQLWNGGEVPVLDDPLYLSIVDELRTPDGQPEGKAWPTRIPTTLTILQADSIGLKVEKALPCHCEDLSDFEDPTKVPCGDGFEYYEGRTMNGGSDAQGTARLYGRISETFEQFARILLKDMQGAVIDFTYADSKGEWSLDNIPAGKYELRIDADNEYDEITYITGPKNIVLTLEDNQVKEYNLDVKKR